MRHTPGPWYTAGTGSHQGLIIAEVTGENVAVTYDARDASLVAAAPDMLEALRAIAGLQRCDAKEWSDLVYRAKDLAREVITKVE